MFPLLQQCRCHDNAWAECVPGDENFWGQESVPYGTGVAGNHSGAGGDASSGSGTVPLRRYFLSTAFAKGRELDTTGTGYVLESFDLQAVVYRHVESEVRVWSQAILLATPCEDDGDLDVMFHYLAEDKFHSIASASSVSAELWSSIGQQSSLHGRGIYATSLEPDQFKDPLEPLPYWAPCTNYCVPILLRKAMVVRVNHGKAEAGLAAGCEKALCCRDLCVIRCEDEARALQQVTTNKEQRLRYIKDVCTVELGADSPRTVDSVSNLALFLEHIGKREEAEPLYQQALEGYKATYGVGHAHYLRVSKNLVGLYHSQGRLSDAEPLCRRVLESSREALGGEHPRTLSVTGLLAQLLRSQGKVGEVEAYYRKILEAHESQLGAEHPDTLTGVYDLACHLHSQGKLEEAEPLYRRAVQRAGLTFAAPHLETLLTLSRLARLLHAQGKLDEAEAFYRRALKAAESMLCAEHPETLTNLSSLAGLFRAQGRLEDAEVLYRRALQGCEARLGPGHPDTVRNAGRLMALLRLQGKADKASNVGRCSDGHSKP